MAKLLSIVLIWSSLFFFPASGHAQSPQQSGLGIVATPLANVHEEPVPKSRLETQVLMGDEVRILEKKDTRYRISIPGQGGREGWIQQEAVQIPKDKGRSFLSIERPWIVIAAPKTDAMILDKTGDHKVPLYAGTRLPVLETRKDRLKVQFPDRSVAIISGSDAMPVKSPDPVVNDTKPEEIVNTAKRFQGAPYLAGGMTVQGMDMNGLISLAYLIHGTTINIGHLESRAQGERISKKDLEPGDILVFSGGGRGLYMGNGRFLHVAKKGRVQLAGVSDRRAGSFQYGVRILGAGPDENKRMAAMTADEVLLAQARVTQLPLGKRIAYWAGRFIGTPYDPDPLGLYVRTNRIVADEKVDCMYHTFRSVELAQSGTPGEAVDRALDLRFISRGKLTDGLVVNYDDRFQYGEDMVTSGKWGQNITAELGAVKTIPGSRGKDTVDILPKDSLLSRALQKKLQDGDIVYWVKDPKKRVVGEIVAHLSVVHVKSGTPWLIHASGSKNHWGTQDGGVVKEVPFAAYVHAMRFVGAFVTRFEQ
jgi:gamma-D-glutamyl-L-lysine dipeptidyl-peptidase